MNHIDSFITEYIDDSLDLVTHEKVKSHLVFCAQCQIKVSELTQLIKSLNSTVPMPVPVGLEEKIFSRLHESIADVQPTFADSLRELFDSFNWKIVSLTMASFLGVIVVLKMKNSTENLNSGLVVTTQPIPLKDNKETLLLQRNKMDLSKGREQLAVQRGYAKDTLDKNPEKEMDRVDRDDFRQRKEEVSLKKKASIPIAIVKEAVAPPSSQSMAMGKSSMGGLMQDEEKTEVKSNFIGEKIIRDEVALNKLLNQLNQDPFPVDFQEEDVMAIVLSPEPTEGYSVSLTLLETTVVEGTPTRVITYTLVPPQEGGKNAAVPTTPFLLKAIPKFSGKTIFRKSP